MDAQANQRRATHLLTHYLRQVHRAAGMQWDSDNDVEVAEIVECIIDAASCPEPDYYAELDAALDAEEHKVEADEEMADHLDNRRRARKQMDGLRRGMGLDTEAEAEARTDYYYTLS